MIFVLQDKGEVVLKMNFVEDTAARYCCAVVGGQSVCHVCSSCLSGSEKLVVIENVCELILNGNKAHFLTVFPC